ncbi:hypothetical protein [Propionivibrio dicarboxylicus]|nr:hypothetical protein [Propionivibrio dicarboxylicus]
MRSYAGMGRLLDSLGLRRLDEGADESEISTAERYPAIGAADTSFPHDDI